MRGVKRKKPPYLWFNKVVWPVHLINSRSFYLVDWFFYFYYLHITLKFCLNFLRFKTKKRTLWRVLESFNPINFQDACFFFQKILMTRFILKAINIRGWQQTASKRQNKRTSHELSFKKAIRKHQWSVI